MYCRVVVTLQYVFRYIKGQRELAGVRVLTGDWDIFLCHTLLTNEFSIILFFYKKTCNIIMFIIWEKPLLLVFPL